MRQGVVNAIDRLFPPLHRLRLQRSHLQSENKRLSAEMQGLLVESHKLLTENQRLSAENQRLLTEKPVVEPPLNNLAECMAPATAVPPYPLSSPHTFEQLLGRKVSRRDLEVLFHIHIPKTAGNTVMSLLSQNGYQQIDLYPPTNDFFQWLDEQTWQRRYEERSSWRPHFFTGHYRLDHSIFRRMRIPYGTLTVLRHPFEQMLSHYNFTLRLPRAPWHDDIVSGRMSFLEYAGSMQSALGPQYSFFDDTGSGTFAPTGKATVRQCLNNLLTKVSFFGFAERFSEFSLALGYLLCQKNVLVVPAQNRTEDYVDITGKPLKSLLTEDERKEMHNIFQDDMWFHEEAKKEYDRRISESVLKDVLARAMPLATTCQDAMSMLETIRDPANPSQFAFKHLL